MKRGPSLMLLMMMLSLAGSSLRAADAPKTVPGIRYLFLVRHGIYDGDPKADDRVGNGLNALGHEQARLVGARLAALSVPWSSFVSSDFTRARETAEDMGVVLGLAPTRDSLLRECTPSSDRPDYMRNHSAAEVSACDSSLQAAWAKYARPSPDADARDLLVCHGNVIRWWVAKALGMDARHWTAMDIANASITLITVRSDGTTRLALFSDVGHLPLEKQTWSGRGMGWTKPSGAMK